MSVSLSSRALLLAVLAGLVIPAAVAAPKKKAAAANPAAASPSAAADKVTIVHVQGNIYMLSGGAGANVTVQVGEQGVVLVDASVPAMSDRIIAAIRTLSDKPIRYILDTGADPDHVAGNEAIASHGLTIGGGYTTDQPIAQVFAHENVLNAMSAPTGKASPYPSAAWPTDTYFKDTMELWFNGEPIQMLYQPAAHSDGDSIVFFRRSDVIAAGDVYLTTTYPVIEMEHGGTINGLIDSLNRIIDITIPEKNQEDGTLVVPGHGRVSDEYDVVVYRDMVTVIRDRVRSLKGKGMTLEQIKASKPTFDYDPRWAAPSGPASADQFVEAIYKTLPTAAAAPTAK
jgi:glyoxylase-like metal-dependent hydrolase (beta-lactamase superfamily II)